MKIHDKALPVLYALLAAVFYAVNTPFSKVLLANVSPTFMAAFLYLGAGAGVGIMYIFHFKKEDRSERLTKKDLPYTLGMIVLDIAAPILLMLGIKYGSAANASLLGNFEIAATTLIALVIFHETVSKRLWAAIALISLSSIILSLEGADSFRFSYGSLFVLSAAVCWGLENNCTRNISGKSTYEIVVLKGLCSGGGSMLVALVLREPFPAVGYITAAMLLGFVAYGLSIFMYIRAQRSLGAAKTSAYYAAAPFVGAFISFVMLGEPLTLSYFTALLIMAAGTALVVADTVIRQHTHMHTHTFSHTHNGVTHIHTITHSHEHNHYASGNSHGHRHSKKQLEALTEHNR